MNSWDVRVFGPAVANLPGTKSTRTRYPAPTFSVCGRFPCYLQHFGPDILTYIFSLSMYLQHFDANLNLSYFQDICSMLELESAILQCTCSFWTLSLSFASLQHFGAITCNLHGFVCSIFKLKSLLCVALAIFWKHGFARSPCFCMVFSLRWTSKKPNQKLQKLRSHETHKR